MKKNKKEKKKKDKKEIVKRKKIKRSRLTFFESIDKPFLFFALIIASVMAMIFANSSIILLPFLIIIAIILSIVIYSGIEAMTFQSFVLEEKMRKNELKFEDIETFNIVNLMVKSNLLNKIEKHRQTIENMDKESGEYKLLEAIYKYKKGLDLSDVEITVSKSGIETMIARNLIVNKNHSYDFDDLELSYYTDLVFEL